MSKQLYRNTETIQNIEPGALWEKVADKFILVDEDQFVSSDETDKFEEEKECENWACVYHDCMVKSCRKTNMINNGCNFGKGKCELNKE